MPDDELMLIIQLVNVNMKLPIHLFARILLALGSILSVGLSATADALTTTELESFHRTFTHNDHGEDGVKFSCKGERLDAVDSAMREYLHSLGIRSDQYSVVRNDKISSVRYSLTTPIEDTSTIDLRFRGPLEIRDELVVLPLAHGKTKTVLTVSEKEIVLSLLQHGRLSEYAGNLCDVDTLKDEVRIRQNIVAWTQGIDWVWPDGGYAKWNAKYWRNGTPIGSTSAALQDAFNQPQKYSVGCYTASKMVYVHAILDYYGRVKRSSKNVAEVERQLLAVDHDPLVSIEPRGFWSFESDFEPEELWRKGKLLVIEQGIPGNNFIPGDWGYFLNTDPTTYLKTGYEGSNAIYLGGGKFDDYYNDNNHSYTFREKIDEVYQWRNGVFSRSRHTAKIKPMTELELEKLLLTPDKGGMVLDSRLFYRPLPQSF